jgi:histone H3
MPTKRSHFFESGVYRVLKQLSNNSGITSNAKQQLNNALCIIARNIASHATIMIQISQKKTISVNDIRDSVYVTLSGELCTNSIIEGEKAVVRYDKDTTTGSSRQDKAGIIFSPSIAEKFLRQFGMSKCMISKQAPIFFAACLEYISAEILDLAITSSFESKHVRITIRDLFLAVNRDKELGKLFNMMKISFLGGGVLQEIRPELLNPKKPRKRRDIAQCEKKPHRFRTGTVALRDIKKYQKMSDCLIFPKGPFTKITRSIISEYATHKKVSKDVFIVLQYYIEQYIVSILQDCVNVCIHAGRVKVMLTDIALVCNMRKIEISI